MEGLTARLEQCQTLREALTVIAECQIEKGRLRIDGDSIHGAIAFQGKNITKAVVAETAQTGRPAVKRLLETFPVKCTLVQEKHAEQGALGEQTLGFGETASRHLPALESVQIRDDLADFLREEGRLNRPSSQWQTVVPLRASVTAAAPQAANEDDSDVMRVLTRLGFTIHMGQPEIVVEPRLFHGDPATLPSAAVCIPRPSVSTSERALIGAALALMIAGIFILPNLLWSSADRETARIGQRRVENLVESALCEDDKVPSANSRVTPPTVVQTAAPAVPQASSSERDESSLSSLLRKIALKQMTPSQIEDIIRRLLATGQIRRARTIAAVATRIPNCTPPQRLVFWTLYQNCLSYTLPISRGNR